MAPDIAAMNPDQAMAELNRLDALSVSRGLSESEKVRLFEVELRLEEFAKYAPGAEVKDPAKDWAYYQELARREAEGEDVFNAKALEGYKGPTIDVKPMNIESKAPLAMAFFAALGFLGLAYRHRHKNKR